MLKFQEHIREDAIDLLIAIDQQHMVDEAEFTDERAFNARSVIQNAIEYLEDPGYYCKAYRAGRRSDSAKL